MIKMIHRVTGCEMWVHESNVNTFLERGHKVAPVPVPVKKPVKKRQIKK